MKTINEKAFEIFLVLVQNGTFQNYFDDDMNDPSSRGNATWKATQETTKEAFAIALYYEEQEEVENIAMDSAREQNERK